MKKLMIGLLFLSILILCISVNGYACNTSIEIYSEKQIYENEKVEFRFKLSDKIPDFKIEYWVEDSNGNIVKRKRNTTNLNKKSYSPKNTGLEFYKIKAKFTEVDCKISLDYISEKKFVYVGEEQDRCCTCINKKGLVYYVADKIESVHAGQKFQIKLNISNYDETSHNLSVWAYVYRGSKVYSESRKSNQINFTLAPFSSEIVFLPVITYADPGQYNVKIKIKKDSQKTNKEIRWKINVSDEQDLFDMKKISIEDVSFVPDQQLLAVVKIKSTFKKDISAGIEMHAPLSYGYKNTIVEQGNNNLVSFNMNHTLGHGKTIPIFFKLKINESLVDVKEIILTDEKYVEEKELPFQLVTGDVIFEKTEKIYDSSTRKSFRIAGYMMLLLSVALNCIFIYKEKRL